MRRPIAIAGLLWALGVASAAEKPARSLAKEARRAEKSGDAARAYLLYSQAAAADPKKREYWVRSQALRTRALRAQPPASLSVGVGQASDSKYPGEQTEVDQIEPEDLRLASQPIPPAELKPPPGKLNFDLRGDARAVFEQVFKDFGMEVIFDAEYQPGQPFRFRLTEVDFRTALRALEAATSSFVVPLSGRLVMVYKDTEAKRRDAEPTVAVTLPLPNPVTIQEAQELARAVQQAMEIQRFAIDSSRRLVLIKDRVSKVRTAQKLYEQLLTHRSQVIIEVEVLDSSARRELNYGANLPTQTAMLLLGRQGPGARRFPFRFIPDFVPGFSRFLVAGGGLSAIALAVSDAQAFARFNESNSTTLFRAQIRSVDSQAATLHIGDKYPIINQQYLGLPAGVPALATPSTFTFEDLGLVLKVTPRIHDSEEVSMTVEAEFKVLGNGSFNGIPVIQNRKFSSTVRLRDGQWAVLAGMLSSTEAKTIAGLPLLGRIPVLSHVLTQRSRTSDSGEAFVLLKPRIIDSPTTEFSSSTLYTGSETRWPTAP
jgi:type II secretory pathway component HofQ